MAKETRRHQNYDLKRGNEVVYRGTTTDPTRREQEHRQEGKQFTKFVLTSRRMTEAGAKRKEAEALARYRRGHGGRNPKYNETDDG